MKPERWKKIETLCQKAMALQGKERTTYLQNSCTGDLDLFEEVMSLLDQEESTLLETPFVKIESSMLFANDKSAPDEMIGPYKLIRLLGTGGMGNVYLAVRNDEEFERFVALKVIKEGVISDEVLSRFISERQILASLNHPHISRLFDGGTTEKGFPWFAMEYVEGTPIPDYCKRHHSSLSEKLNLFLNVCATVQYAHQNLVIHRDIKPPNILITENGQPKLLDFGIAKLMDLEQDPRVTQYQNRLMTPEYASPEQVKHEPVSTVSDVYSLGVLLYELLTGELPYHFEKRTPAHIEHVICNQEPAKPSGVSGDPNLKGDLDNIIWKALKKNPDERYSSVEQFAEDIRRYQKALPVIARKDSLAYRSRKFLRRHTWSVGVSIVMTLLILTFATVTYIQSRTIEARAVEAENQRDRAEEISDFLVDLFASVDPSEAQDESLTAIELLHRGAERVETELSDQPALQANLFLVISDVYESLGLFDEGIDQAERALAIQKKLYGDTHPEVATSLNAIGWINHEKGDFDKSDSLLQTALAMRYDLFGNDHLDVARTLNDLAVLKQSQGDFTATDSLLVQSLEIRRNLLGDDHESVGITLSNYAALQYVMGDLEGAIESMDEVLRNFRINFGEKHLRIAVALNNLGAFLSANSELDKAEEVYREALQMRYDLVGEEHPSIAFSLAHLGNLLRVKKEYDEAEEMIRKSLELRIKLLGEDHVVVGHSYRALGNLYFEKEEYDEAEKYFALALNTFRNLFPEGHTDNADALHLLGEVYLKMNDPSRAEPVFREAMETRIKFFADGDTRTADSMIKLGVSLVDRGEYIEAKELLINGIDIINHSGRDMAQLKTLAEETLAGL
ncbi:serine/threonine-protein kinase [Rhodohalobacter sp. 614A]|uniref:serine/threonine-protein kinase n=1 Tax=Rhodohalobacter sp. 614A TaxID=2908649 RepID=UPI001F19AFC0|nr:serine/threonine-protein kinase [Rhodohalobacter sp. 614A]